MTESERRPATAIWVKIVLALSLALNLAVIGVVVGAMAKGGRGGNERLQNEISFGPFTEALSRADRRALRVAFLARVPELRANKDAAKAEFATVLQSLQADPFEPEAFRRSLAAIEARNAERLRFGRILMETRILEMSAEDRLAFAQRLEAGLGKKSP